MILTCEGFPVTAVGNTDITMSQVKKQYTNKPKLWSVITAYMDNTQS